MSTSFDLRRAMRLLSLAAALSAVPPVAAVAQAPGVPVPDQSFEGLEREEHELSEKIAVLADADKLLPLAKVEALLAKPRPAALKLPAARTEARRAVDLYDDARKGFVRLGWCYLCPNCERWHTELACGYAITADGAIATCAHVISKPEHPMREASLVAVDWQGNVHPVTDILQVHEGMDAAIVRVDATLQPLPLDDQTRPGMQAYCFSRPLDQRAFFSNGMVNRFYFDRHVGERSDRTTRLAAVRMDVDMPWAPGSSGAAILDVRGNVIGHVTEIRPMDERFGVPPEALGIERPDDPSRKVTAAELNGATILLTLHVAVPARGVMHLARGASPAKGSR